MTLVLKSTQLTRPSGAQPGTTPGVRPHLAPFVPLDTPRLALVALSLEHAPAVFAYASDPEISHLVAWPRHEHLEASRRFVARAMVGYAEGGYYEWGLIQRTDQAFLGTCGFGEIDMARGVGDIGYVLAKPYWGQGYATEAAAAVLQFGFVQLGLRLIEAQAFPENIASLRVMAKLGLRYRETRPMSQEPGMSYSVCVWQIEREQWVGRHTRAQHDSAGSCLHMSKQGQKG
jgi:RimJ/RimL family protein N-acetyltransferase